MIQRRCAVKGLASLGALASVGALSQTQAYPSKPIRFCIPGTPGGGTDTIARLVVNGLAEARKWLLVPENLPGAGGNIGLAAVAKAPNDGYTIGIGETSNLVIGPYLYNKLPFNAAEDLEPVVLLAKVPLVLVVGMGSQFDSVASVIAAAKKRALTFATSGNGSVGHLMTELWTERLGLQKMTHIPYKGAAQAITDVASGHVDIFFASISTAISLIQASKVRPLGVTSQTRVSLLKEVPSFGELGLKDVEATVSYGVVVPKGTPPVIVSMLNTEINKVLRTPSVRQVLTNQGADSTIFGGDQKLFSAFLWQERVKWGKVVKESGAKIE